MRPFWFEMEPGKEKNMNGLPAWAKEELIYNRYSINV